MFLEIFLLFVTAAIALAVYVKRIRWNYWKNLGVFQIPGSIPVDDLLMLRHITDIVVRLSFNVDTFIQNLSFKNNGPWWRSLKD